jgi:hypothetical protein
VFKKFIRDKEALDMYVTGAAGTGKTTQCKEDVQYCIDNKIPYVVCAYTHKACAILASKLQPEANVKTLHSFLGKRPTINVHAIKTDHVSNSSKSGSTDDEPKVLFLDEYSMIGEKDWQDIQDAEIKVVWLGNKHQLPPVGDIAAIKPQGNYQKILTKQWRNDNPLQQPLNKLISYLDGQHPEPLKAVEGYFERGVDIVKAYLKYDDAVILAYTNQRVQELNAMAQGALDPERFDQLFSPTARKEVEFVSWLPSREVHAISIPRDDKPLELETKYRTLEGLIKSKNCKFAEVLNSDGTLETVACVFGHYDYKKAEERLRNAAVESNLAIEQQHKCKAAPWAQANRSNKLAKTRAKAWRDYLSFNDCVICLDFNHAMTVHKSQGSTFDVVCLDTDNLALAMRDFQLYLKLTYVGISRASKKVYTP